MCLAVAPAMAASPAATARGWLPAVRMAIGSPAFETGLAAALRLESVDLSALPPESRVWSAAVKRLERDYGKDAAAFLRHADPGKLMTAAVKDALGAARTRIRASVEVIDAPDSRRDRIAEAAEQLRKDAIFAGLMPTGERMWFDSAAARARQITAFSQAESLAGTLAARLAGDPDFGSAAAAMDAQVPNGANTIIGGNAVIIIDDADPSVFYKRAKLGHPAENKMQLTEARAAVHLERLAVEGVPRLRQVGLEKGKIWLRLTGIVQGDRLNSPLWETLNVLRKLDTLIAFAGIFERMHAAGWLHNDIKPGNLLVNRAGEALVIDLGIASLEGHRRAIGSLGFTPPEKTLTRYSDIYSFGVTLGDVLARHPSISEDESNASGLTKLVGDMTRYRWEARQPRTMAQVAAALTEIRDYFRSRRTSAVVE